MTTKAQTLLPLPDPPEREPEDMTSFQHLAKNGNLHHLAQYLDNPDTTIVSAERFIVPGAARNHLQDGHSGHAPGPMPSSHQYERH